MFFVHLWHQKIQTAILSDGKITEIFCLADGSCKFFNDMVMKHSLVSNDGKDHGQGSAVPT